MLIKNIIVVALGGAFGSVGRFLISYFLNGKIEPTFPVSTFLVNIIGSLILGLLTGYLSKNQFANNMLPLLLTTGFCGGFTTFSTFSLENVKLLQQGQLITATIYSASSLALGFLAVYAGIKIIN